MTFKKRFSDLNKRLISSFITVSVVACLIAFSPYPLVAELLFLSVVALAGIGVWEYANLAYAKELNISWPAMLVIAALQITGFFLSVIYPEFSQLPVFILVAAVVLFFLLHFNEIPDALICVAVEFFGVCYVAVPLSLLLGILYLPPTYQDGRMWLFYLLIVTKATDIFGYFIGKQWGKHPLAVSLSPKKTIEGAMGGFIGAILTSIGFWWLASNLPISFFNLSFCEALILGALFGVLAQIGDLAESLLKRDALVKDSNVLPGFGGVLDMLDSLLFTTPFLYLFLTARL